MIYSTLPDNEDKNYETEIALYFDNAQLLKHQEAELLNTLCAEEKERAEKFVFEKDRLTYTLSHGYLRKMLGYQLNLAPDKIQFTKGTFEKPQLEDASVHFNLSHSNESFAIALSATHPVGIDIESIARKVNFDQIATSFFSINEQELLDEAAHDQKLHTFYTIWTRKEALLKAIGTGITDYLPQFDVTKPWFEPTLNIDTPTPYKRYYIKSFLVKDHLVSVATVVPFRVVGMNGTSTDPVSGLFGR